MFAVLCSKFIQGTIYQLSSESAVFVEELTQTFRLPFILGHGVDTEETIGPTVA